MCRCEGLLCSSLGEGHLHLGTNLSQLVAVEHREFTGGKEA